MRDEPPAPVPGTLGEALVTVWSQVLLEQRAKVALGSATFAVDRTRKLGLKTVFFTFAGVNVEGIEQNPETKSRWAQLARSGSKIMQYRVRGRYVANVCDGSLNRYPAWAGAGIPP